MELNITELKEKAQKIYKENKEVVLIGAGYVAGAVVMGTMMHLATTPSKKAAVVTYVGKAKNGTVPRLLLTTTSKLGTKLELADVFWRDPESAKDIGIALQAVADDILEGNHKDLQLCHF